MINITCNQGSTGKISEQVGVMLQQRGWDVYLAHGSRRVNASKLISIPFSSVAAEYKHALRSLLFDEDGLGSSKATNKLIKVIKKINPDVIQIHNLHGYYINYKLLFEFLNSTNIPVVMTLHDCWTFTGHCVHFVTAGCYKWETGCHNCILKSVYPKKSLFFDRSSQNYKLKQELFTANKNLHVVTVSDWLGDMARRSMLRDKDINVIPNGVDIIKFTPLEVENNTFFTILAVSNVWHKDKGLYDFIELSKSLKDDEKILLVGTIPERIKKDLPDNIIAIHHTRTQEDLVELYNKSDVVVSMSYAETFGLTIAEGAACGKPSIVYDNTAQTSLISPDTGFTVKTGDVNAVYNAIQCVKKKGSASYKAACRQYAIEHFDKEKCFSKYVDLYESLISKNR